MIVMSSSSSNFAPTFFGVFWHLSVGFNSIGADFLNEFRCYKIAFLKNLF